MGVAMTPLVEEVPASAMDRLRAGLMVLVVLLTAIIGFGDRPLDAHSAIDLVALALLPLLLPSCFFVAGYFGHGLLKSSGGKAFWQNRAARILVPFLGCWLLFRRSRGMDSHAGYAHLWFLFYLLHFYAISYVRSVLLSRRPPPLGGLFSKPWHPLVMGLVSAVSLLPLVNGSWSLPHETFRAESKFLFVYGVPFIWGWALSFFGVPLALFREHAKTWLLAGGALLATHLICRGILGGPTDPKPLAAFFGAALSGGLSTACLVAGCIGWAQSRGPSSNRAVTYLAESSYSVYLLHLPIVILLSEMLSRYELGAFVRTGLTFVGALAFSLFIYDLAVRPSWLGVLLNGERKKSGLFA
jgi:glucan biosynthesis protein C